MTELSCDPNVRGFDSQGVTADACSAYALNTRAHDKTHDTCPFPDGKWRKTTITRGEYDRMTSES